MTSAALTFATRLLWLLLAALWLGAEAGLARRRPAAVDYREQRSEYLLRGVAGGCLGLALLFKTLHWLPLPFSYLPRQLAALLLFAAGLGLRFHAVAVLGRFFTTEVALHSSHELIVRGAYRWLRHPAYAGLLLAFAAAGIAMGDGLALGVLTVPLFYAIRKRIAVEEQLLTQRFGSAYVEEQLLTQRFGSAYDAYRRKTRRLIPWLY